MSNEPESKLSEEFVTHLEGGEPTDSSETFEYLLAFRNRAWREISNRLSITEDLACADIHEFNDLDGNKVGNMRTYTGDQSPIDWVIRSNIGDPKKTFSNIHLTVWNDETVEVPHLGSAFGTLPDVFFYVDLMPRYDLLCHPQHLDQFLERLNDSHLVINKAILAAGITPFVPAMSFIRASLSPCALAGVVPLEFFKKSVEPHLWDAYQYWIELMEHAQTTPQEYRAELKARDQLIRNNIVELDPANPIAVRLVGQDMTDRLVRILSAKERST